MTKEIVFQSVIKSKCNGINLSFLSNKLIVKVEQKQLEPKITYYARHDECHENRCYVSCLSVIPLILFLGK